MWSDLAGHPSSILDLCVAEHVRRSVREIHAADPVRKVKCRNHIDNLDAMCGEDSI